MYVFLSVHLSCDHTIMPYRTWTFTLDQGAAYTTGSHTNLRGVLEIPTATLSSNGGSATVKSGIKLTSREVAEPVQGRSKEVMRTYGLRTKMKFHDFRENFDPSVPSKVQSRYPTQLNVFGLDTPSLLNFVVAAYVNYMTDLANGGFLTPPTACAVLNWTGNYDSWLADVADNLRLQLYFPRIAGKSSGTAGSSYYNVEVKAIFLVQAEPDCEYRPYISLMLRVSGNWPLSTISHVETDIHVLRDLLAFQQGQWQGLMPPDFPHYVAPVNTLDSHRVEPNLLTEWKSSQSHWIPLKTSILTTNEIYG